MNNITFSRQIKNQKKHWWFQARKKIIEQIISGLRLKKKSSILDFGAGSSVNLNMLSYIIFAAKKNFIKYFNLPFGISIYALAKNV